MNSIFYIIIIILLLLIILYQYLHKTNSSNKIETVIEKTTVVDMKVESESTIKLDLKPVVDVKNEDYDTMVGRL